MSPAFTKRTDRQGNVMNIFLYVDYMIYGRNLMFYDFKVAKKEEIEIINLSLMNYFLGIKVE